MRRSLLLLLCLGLLAVLPGCGSDASSDKSQTESSASSSTPVRPGMMREVGPRPVPKTAVQTLKGETFDFGAQEGRVLVINFWATWCAPCRKEIPDLVALQKELPADQFTVVGVSVDREGASKVGPFVDKYDVNYPIVLDPEQTLAPKFGSVQGLPTTFVVNAEGQIVRRVLGLVSIEELRPELEQMMEET